jgi:hypothetical protein
MNPEDKLKGKGWFDPKKYKESWVYRLEANWKIALEPIPGIILVIPVILALFLMNNKALLTTGIVHVLLLIGIISLLAKYQKPKTLSDRGWNAEDLARGIKFNAAIRGKCYRCWKPINKMATKCPHCTADL